MTNGQWLFVWFLIWCAVSAAVACLWSLAKAGVLRRHERRRREAWLNHITSLPVPVVDWVAWEKQVSYE